MAAADHASSGSARTGLAFAIVAVIVIAGIGVGAYMWGQFRSQASPTTRYLDLIPGSLTLVTAQSETNGPGGCAAPGAGLIEYCYTSDLAYDAILAVSPNFSAEELVYETTADASFVICCSGSGNVSFVNVTLLDDSGRILATYSTATNWTAYGGDTLPIVLSSNETIVLNVGTTSASGDQFWFYQGAWGFSGISLP